MSKGSDRRMEDTAAVRERWPLRDRHEEWLEEKRRGCLRSWQADLLRRCHAAGVPFFMKQMNRGKKVVKDIAEFPSTMYRVQEWPEMLKGGGES